MNYLFCSAALLAGTAAGASASSPIVHPSAVGQQSEARLTPSLRELSVSAANIRALQAQAQHGPAAMLQHRFPDGALSRTAAAPPYSGAPNVAVVAGPSLGTPPANVTGFTGITDGLFASLSGGELEPPDQGLAVNNGTVVEIVNNAIQITDSTGKTLANPVTTNTFFGDSSDNLSDPHAVYLPAIKRWIVEELVYSNSFNGFFVAVSKTSDPTGAYYVNKVDAMTAGISACGGSCLPDYPQVGFDKNGFYIGADLFSNSSGNFVNAAIYALPLKQLQTGAKFSYTFFQSPDFVVQPAQPAPGAPFATAANGTEYLMTARNIYDGSTNVRVFALSNTNKLPTAPSSLTLTSVDVAVETYTSTVPSTEPNDVGPYGKSVGAKRSPQLDGGYNAFGGGVKYAAGNLYGALTTGTTDANGLARDVIAYFVLTPAATKTAVKAKIAAQGYITPAAGYSLSYPGIALDKTGTGVIGTTIVNKSAKVAGGYPSTGFIEFQNNAPAGNYTVTGQGAASDDGFTGYSGSKAVVGRWGDFASAVVDAATGYYWTGNEYIPDAKQFPRGQFANWGTFITQVH